jgi:hypothetical protein
VLAFIAFVLMLYYAERVCDYVDERSQATTIAIIAGPIIFARLMQILMIKSAFDACCAYPSGQPLRG